jgi:hypothetical protein
MYLIPFPFFFFFLSFHFLDVFAVHYAAVLRFKIRHYISAYSALKFGEKCCAFRATAVGVFVFITFLFNASDNGRVGRNMLGKDGF